MRTTASIAKVLATLILVAGAARTYFIHGAPHYTAAITTSAVCCFILLSSLSLPPYAHSALLVLTASWLSEFFADVAFSTGSFLVDWPRYWPDPFACLVFTLVLFATAAGTSAFLFQVRPATAVAAASAFVFFHPIGSDTLSYTKHLLPGTVLLALPALLVTFISPARLRTRASQLLYTAVEPLLVVTLGWLVAVPFQQLPLSSCMALLWHYHLPYFALPACIAATVLVAARFRRVHRPEPPDAA